MTEQPRDRGGEPSLRKPAGVLLILLLIAIWCALVLLLSPVIGRLPALAQFPIYLVLGIIWITPLKPLLAWMDR